MAWSKPQKPVCLDFPRQFCSAKFTSFCHASVLDNKSLIRHFVSMHNIMPQIMLMWSIKSIKAYTIVIQPNTMVVIKAKPMRKFQVFSEPLFHSNSTSVQCTYLVWCKAPRNSYSTIFFHFEHLFSKHFKSFWHLFLEIPTKIQPSWDSQWKTCKSKNIIVFG